MRAALVLLATLAGTAIAEPIHNEVRRVPLPAIVSDVANSHTLFLNNCLPNGCTVHPGSTDSRSDSSELASATSSLSAWAYGTTAWASLVSCVATTMAPFDITVTDVDPGTAAHFEVMVAGNSSQLHSNPALGSNVGGVAPLACNPPGNCAYIPNALVFDFAAIWGQGTTCDNNCVLNVCATASQEIAHAWTLDHVVDGTDPMSYNLQYAPVQPFFHDHETCGSDCIGGKSPLNFTCSSSDDRTATHTCFSTDTATQNELATILALFGAGSAAPPAITFVRPTDGANVAPGFAVEVTVATQFAVAEVALTIDNAAIISTKVTPYIFNSPSSLGPGTHHVTVTATDNLGMTGTASVDVTIGDPCTKPGDCPTSTDTCVAGRCVPGEGVQGGLGSPCANNSVCNSGICASGAAGMVCVDPCDVGMNQCPSSFDCVAVSSGGVCYPAADSGGGGCSSSSGGSMLLGLGFAAVLLRRRPLAMRDR